MERGEESKDGQKAGRDGREEGESGCNFTVKVFTRESILCNGFALNVAPSRLSHPAAKH
jgi:hypothetical protein